MPSAVFTDSRFRLDYTISVVRQEVANNRSLIRTVLTIVKTGSSYANSGNVSSYGVGAPSGQSGNFTYNFGNYSSLTLVNREDWVPHSPDGTYSLLSSAWVTADSPLGSASIPQFWTTFPPIPRASLPVVTGGFTTGTASTITMDRASSAFTHDVSWSIGEKSGSLGTGIATTVGWTPPHDLMTELPNAASGQVTITVVTKNGATVVGTTNTAIPLTAGAAVVPSVSAVLWDDQNTTVKTNIGAFVQGLSLIKGTVTAAGIHGSTVASKRLVVAGNSLPESQVFQITDPGTVVASGEATDSRGRSGSKAANFTVLAYEAPKIGANDWKVQRANASNVADSNGQYLRLDLHAIAKSLIVGSEKNSLKVSVRTRPLNGAWTNRNIITPGLVQNGAIQISGGAAFLGSQSYEVEVTITDNTGVSPLVLRTTVGTTIVTIDLRANQVGIGKMHEQGALDVAGDIYMSGTKVSVQGHTHTGADVAAATETARGTVERATQAETNAGTDTTRYVSPKNVRDSVDKILASSSLPSQVIVTTAWADILTAEVVTRGGDIVAQAFMVAYNAGSGLDRQIAYRIICDGVVFSPVLTGVQAIPLSHGGASYPRMPSVMWGNGVLPAGTHTFKLQASASAHPAIYVEASQMTIIERGKFS